MVCAFIIYICLVIGGVYYIMRERDELAAISLFSGGGGFDFGIKSAGFSIKVSCDIEEYACQTLRRNFPNTLVIGPPNFSGDLRCKSPEEFMHEAGIRKGDVSLVFGGPPCQPFSIASNQRFRKLDERFKRVGFSDSQRGDLVRIFINYVAEIEPYCFILENVPGLRDIDGGRTLSLLISRLNNLGYTCSIPTIVNAVNFGVPQYRERLFIVGVRGSRTQLKLPTSDGRHGGEFVRVVAHALTSMPNDLANHVTRNHLPSTIERYRKLRFGQREPLGRVDRLSPNSPSKTIIAGGSNGGGRSHLHPYIARTLTVRECTRLQGFEDDYVFEGSIARQFTQVGNAVPPLVAFNIGKFVAKEVFGLCQETNVRLATYLERDKNIETLCRRLHLESISLYPEWVYFDSINEEMNIGELKLAL